MADGGPIPSRTLHDLLAGYVKAMWPAVDPDELALRLTYDGSHGGEPELVALVAAAYAAGHKARLAQAEKYAIVSAADDAAEEVRVDWAGALCDTDHLDVLLSRQPHAPELAADPYVRRLELDAILAAACAMAEVDRV